MFYPALLDRGQQSVIYSLLVGAHIGRTNTRRDHRVRCLSARTCFRHSARVGYVSNECVCTLLCESFEPLRVAAHNTHFPAVCEKCLRYDASSVSCGACDNVHELLLVDSIGRLFLS